MGGREFSGGGRAAGKAAAKLTDGWMGEACVERGKPAASKIWGSSARKQKRKNE